VYQEFYHLYLSCFPNYPVSEKLFNELLQPNLAHIIEHRVNGELIAFSMVHGSSVSLLCVDAKFRRQGIGSDLLQESEIYIRNSDSRHIRLGRGRHYLLQGVPTDDNEVVLFFERRGYTASWTSTNMHLELCDFSLEQLNIPWAPEGIAYRFATDDDIPSLFDAIADAQSAWKSVYETCSDPVFIAVRDGKVLGFEVLSPFGGRFVPSGEKVGCVGCVGVIKAERKKGIGRTMVVKGIDWLKSQNCTSIELRYVEIVDWYRKIGFESTHFQWMGEKEITA